MIDYFLEDEDGNQYELSGDTSTVVQPAKGSVTFLTDAFGFDSKVIENSSLPGAVKLGKTRLKSNVISLEIDRALPVSADFRAAENEFIEWLEKTVYLVDDTNSRRIKVNIEGAVVSYDSGGHKLSSKTKASLRLINPYWEDLVEQDQDESLIVDINSIAIVNDGFLEAYPILTFTAAAAVSQIEAYVDETSRGIVINDSIFGTGTFLTLEVDSEAGTIKIGDIDRSASIAATTGYFTFPPGTSTLKVTPNAVCDLNIKWRNREFV